MTGRQRPAALDGLVAGLTDERRAQGVAGSRPGRGGRAAAVLVIISGDGTEGSPFTLVLCERAGTLRHHPGQIAFPGGAAEDTDADLGATAVREATEEIGLDPGSVEVLGTVPAVHVAVSGFDVTAVVAWWAEPHPIRVVDVNEVAAVLRVGVDELADPEHRVTVVHPSGYRGPAFTVQGLLVWGLTAHLVDGLLELAGWSVPWDHDRTAEIPDRYLRDRRPTPGGPDAH